MPVSVHSMVRLLIFLAIGSTILAVGVSRFDPPQQVCRFPRPATSVNINDYFLKVTDRQPRWLDAQTGKLTVIPMRADDVLDEASCSPWVDGAGKRQVVGRWSSRTWSGPETITHAFGIGRYSFPDGEALNQIACDVVPVGPPCWFPGTQARVLFTAGDGRLYRFDFEPTGVGSSTVADLAGPPDSKPVPLTWRCPRPGVGDVFLGELSWPDDPRLAGRLIVSLRLQYHDAAGDNLFSRSQLWWLKVDAAGNQIVAAGPLLNHDLSGDDTQSSDERSPVMAGLPDGSLALAYTRQLEEDSGWCVCLATLPTPTDGHLIPALESQSRVYSVQTQPAPMIFSPDGRWLNVLVGLSANDRAVARISTLPPVVAQNSPRCDTNGEAH